MILNDKSKVIHISNTGISDEVASKFYIPNTGLSMKRYDFLSALVIINDELYYVKYDNILNELIGSFLAKKIELDSVDYQIGIFRNLIYTMSKVFYDREYNYFYPKDYPEFKHFSKKIHPNLVTDIYCFKSYLKQFDDKIKDELLKLIALDLKMGNSDRHGHNLMLKQSIETGIIDLAPIYDYGRSYTVFDIPFKYYQNVYFLTRNNRISLSTLVRKYPQIMEYIDILKNIEMDEILEAIALDKNIKIEDKERCHHLNRDKEYTKILKQI